MCLESEKLKLGDLMLCPNRSRITRRIKVFECLSFILGLEEVFSLSERDLERLREKLITQTAEISFQKFIRS